MVNKKLLISLLILFVSYQTYSSNQGALNRAERAQFHAERAQSHYETDHSYSRMLSQTSGKSGNDNFTPKPLPATNPTPQASSDSSSSTTCKVPLSSKPTSPEQPS